MSEISDSYDVVILGSGLSSLCLARLLSREAPEVSVLSVDKREGIGRKVGESTVEIGAHFLGVRLGLFDLLTQTQLPKNGLRFWFDDEERSLSWDDSSEDGPGAFAHWRTVQLERETLEEALVDMNRSAGATHLFGAKQIKPDLGEGDARHRVRFTHDGAEHTVSARWLVDATGVASFFGRAQKNLVREDRITHSAAWTWFEGAKKIDAFVSSGGPVRFTGGPRCVSTNLLLNQGYWIWLIPLASGLLSVGVGYDETRVQDPPGTRDELVAFLKRHRKLRDLLADAEALEFGVLRNFSYRPKRYFTEDRVGWLGQAAGFVDPFFANGIDQIALGCEHLTDLIRRDVVAQEGLDLERLRAYERTMELVFEHFVLSIGNMFGTFASNELGRVRYRRDVHVYWCVYVWTYLSGKLLDTGHLAGFHALAEDAQRRTVFFTDLLRHTCADLEARGLLYRMNRRQHAYNQLGFRNTAYVRFEQKLGDAPDLPRCTTALNEIDTGCFLGLLDSLTDADRSPVRRLLYEAASPVLPELMERYAASGAFDDAFWDLAFERLSDGVHAALKAEGVEIERLAITKATYPDLLRELLARCPDEETARTVRRHFNSKPRLVDFSDLQTKGDVQPEVRWETEHTPWLEASPTFQSVYDILGETWWDDPARPYSALAKFGPIRVNPPGA